MTPLSFFSCVFLLFSLIVNVGTQKGSISSKYCSNRSDCGEYFGYICGQNQTCHCDRFYTINRYGDRCVGGVGQKCKYDEHCIEGAFCEFQVRCQCKDDLYPSENGLACSRSKQGATCKPRFFAVVFLLYMLKANMN